MFEAPHSALLCNILKHAIKTPDKIALVEGDKHVTYAQLVSNINRAAQLMQAAGLGPGDRIVLAALKELPFVYYYFAAHLLGVVNVVVDASSPRERLDYITSVVKPSALSLASRRLSSLPTSAFLTFCRWSIVLSISSIALWNFSLARR